MDIGPDAVNKPNSKIVSRKTQLSDLLELLA